jgi:hypothetical protein
VRLVDSIVSLGGLLVPIVAIIVGGAIARHNDGFSGIRSASRRSSAASIPTAQDRSSGDVMMSTTNPNALWVSLRHLLIGIALLTIFAIAAFRVVAGRRARH